MKFKHLSYLFIMCGALHIINTFIDFAHKKEFSEILNEISTLIILFYWFFAALKFNEEEKLF